MGIAADSFNRNYGKRGMHTPIWFTYWYTTFWCEVSFALHYVVFCLRLHLTCFWLLMRLWIWICNNLHQVVTFLFLILITNVCKQIVSGDVRALFSHLLLVHFVCDLRGVTLRSGQRSRDSIVRLLWKTGSDTICHVGSDDQLYDVCDSWPSSYRLFTQFCLDDQVETEPVELPSVDTVQTSVGAVS